MTGKRWRIWKWKCLPKCGAGLSGNS